MERKTERVKERTRERNGEKERRKRVREREEEKVTWKEHMSVSSTLIMAPALSNSPQ